jgi:hypothetical protein
MRGCYTIRSNSIPNREHRQHARNYAQQAAFAACRPLTPESYEAVSAALDQAKIVAGEELGGAAHHVGAFAARGVLALTYIDRGLTTTAIKNGALSRYDSILMATSLREYNEEVGTIENVPIQRFDWCGNRMMKLAAFLDWSNETDQLAHDATALEGLLDEAGATTLTTRDPDHLSLGRYKGPSDNGVRVRHLELLPQIVHRQFAEAGIETLSFSELTLDDLYAQPTNEKMAA